MRSTGNERFKRVGEQALPRTIGEALAYARALCATRGEVLTPNTAQALLAYVTGRGRAWLLAHPEEVLAPQDAERFAILLKRAAEGEPLAYLVGEREFYGFPFSVTPDVLVPRPETEALVDVALEWISARGLAAPRVVDVGTGSGAIAVTLALKLPAAQIIAVDISWEALLIAQINAVRHSVAERLALVLGDLLEALIGPFDVILANLPYVSQAELEALEVGRWEPRIALNGGADGLHLVRRLIDQAPKRLVRGGLLALEIGAEQGPPVIALCRAVFPQAEIAILPDLAGHDRIVRVITR